MSNVDTLSLVHSEDSIWTCCAEPMREQVGDSAFFSWIEPLKFLGIEDSLLRLSAPNELARNWVEAHYLDKMVAAVRSVADFISHIQIEVMESLHGKPAASAPVIKGEILQPLAPVGKASKFTLKDNRSELSRFYPDYRFDTFVVGECNRLVHSCAMTVAQAPGDNNYNPLVVYGKSGLGKTHILQAIGRFVIEHETAQNVMYRTAEDFLRDYIASVREHRSEQFYKLYEVCDVLILDDLQFIAKKVKTQDELFKILSRLLAKKKQVILSCDQLPSEVEGLDQRLLSRFHSGLCLSINPMDLQTRLDFLHRKASSEGLGLELSEDSFRWLATHFRSNVRELEGVLVKLLGLRNLMQVELTLENIRSMVGEVVRSENATISLSSILDSTALAFGIKPELLAARSRVQSLSVPRKIAIKLCRELTDHSLETIGYQFNRDYSTVIASLKSVETLLETDPAVKEKYESIRLELLG